MSRAVVICSGSGRPEALRNVVFGMPISRALRVIRRAKFASVPPMCWARAMATSLADLVTRALMALSDGQLLAGLEVQLGGGRGGAFLGHLDLGIVVEPSELDQLEGHVEGHHLGERGRVDRLVACLIVQHGAGVGVDDHGWRPCGSAAWAGTMACEGGDHRARRGNQAHQPSCGATGLRRSVHHPTISTLCGACPAHETDVSGRG